MGIYFQTCNPCCCSKRSRVFRLYFTPLRPLLLNMPPLALQIWLYILLCFYVSLIYGGLWWGIYVLFLLLCIYIYQIIYIYMYVCNYLDWGTLCHFQHIIFRQKESHTMYAIPAMKAPRTMCIPKAIKAAPKVAATGDREMKS